MVTYHPVETTLQSSVRAAAAELDRLIVVDNSTDPAEQRLVDRVVRDGVTTREGRPPEVCGRHGNVGLPRALNEGLRRGLEEGLSLFLLLDQDSVLQPGAATALLDAYAQLSSRLANVELSARNVDESPSQFQNLLDQVFYRSSKSADSTPRRSPLAMTSGLLLSAAVLRTTGFFDESLFLDAVDHEFCLRSWRLGAPLYVEPRAEIHHALGRPRRARWGPFSIELRGAEEPRLYYSTRDTLKVARRHLRVRPLVCGTMFGFIASRSVIYGLLSRSQPGWFRAICRGWADFLRGADQPLIPRAV